MKIERDLGTQIGTLIGKNDRMRRTLQVQAVRKAATRVEHMDDSAQERVLSPKSYVTDQNLLMGLAVIEQFILDTHPIESVDSHITQEIKTIDQEFEQLPFELIGEIGVTVHAMNISSMNIDRQSDAFKRQEILWRKVFFHIAIQDDEYARNEAILDWNERMGPLFVITPGSIEYARTQLQNFKQMKQRIWNGVQKVIDVVGKKRDVNPEPVPVQIEPLPQSVEEVVPPFVSEVVVEKKKRRPSIASFGVVVTSVHKYVKPEMNYVDVYRLMTNIDRALTNDGMVRIAGISEQDKHDFLQDRIQRIKDNPHIKKEKERERQIEEIAVRVNDVWLRITAYKQLGTSTR